MINGLGDMMADKLMERLVGEERETNVAFVLEDEVGPAHICNHVSE